MISVVGTGPGGPEHITPAVAACIRAADIVIGYSTYLDLLNDLLVDKEVISSSMMQEVARCRRAFDLAEAGRRVVMVSGGDPGIYAMAGLLFEIAMERNSDLDIEVIPGIAAINSCAARLGAPLMHDFAAVSLSDLLTPWETIERRLHAAASADFVIAIYNPKSKKRTEHIVKAREILLQYRKPSTPVGDRQGGYPRRREHPADRSGPHAHRRNHHADDHHRRQQPHLFLARQDDHAPRLQGQIPSG